MKVVIVTGASSGIGLATAQFLQKNDWKVYGVARRACDCTFDYLCGDVTDTARMKEILADVFAKEGHIDALVNNAGIGISGAQEDISPQSVGKQFDVNVVALANLCALAVPYLRESGGGKIVNVGSVAGIVPIPFQACYSASKAAVEAFSRALGGEVRRFHIFTTCVLVGDTKTGFTDARAKFVEKDGAYGGRADRSVAKMEKDEQKGNSPESVAKVVGKILKKRRPPVRKTVGFSYKLLVGLARILPARAVDALVAKIYG